jgi:hypothetical protein
MNKTLMGSVAAVALTATAGFAFAQGTGMGGSKGGEAPAAAPRAADSPSSGAPSVKGTASDPKPMGDSKSASESKSGPDPKSASDQKMAPPTKSNTTAQDKAATPSGTNGTKSATDAKSATDNKTATDTKTTTDSKTATDTKTGNAKSGSAATTGNAATSATAAPPTEKRTQITTAIRQEKVEEVRNVNFNISVGVSVPSTVRVHPVPTRVIEIYPEWRGYDFIFVNGRYVILRPQTREIVYVIEG